MKKDKKLFKNLLRIIIIILICILIPVGLFYFSNWQMEIIDKRYILTTLPDTKGLKPKNGWTTYVQKVPIYPKEFKSSFLNNLFYEDISVYYYRFNYPSNWLVSEYSPNLVSIKPPFSDQKKTNDPPYISVDLSYTKLGVTTIGINNYYNLVITPITLKGLEGEHHKSDIYEHFYLNLPDKDRYFTLNQTHRNVESDLVFNDVVNSFDFYSTTYKVPKILYVYTFIVNTGYSIIEYLF